MRTENANSRNDLSAIHYRIKTSVICLLAAVGFLFTDICFAQNNIPTSIPPGSNPAYKRSNDSVNALQQAAVATHKITAQFNLNAQQTNEIENITYRYYFQLDSVYSSLSSTTNVPSNTINQIKTNYYNALGTVLNANQVQNVKSNNN